MSVLIALPCYGGNVNEKTTTGLFKLGKDLVRANIDHGLLTLSNQSLISAGRSRVANFFMNNTDYEYLFFLDADIGFQPDDFFELWKNRDLNLISGAYPMKDLPLQYNYNLVQPINQIRDNIVEITGIGLGFTLISRRVFSAISAQFSELKYTPSATGSSYPPTAQEMQNSYHYFLERKVANVFLSEDHSFFSRARDCGFHAWLSGAISLAHTGYYVFEKGRIQ